MAECVILCVVMLKVTYQPCMLNVVMLNVIMLNAVMLNVSYVDSRGAPGSTDRDV